MNQAGPVFSPSGGLSVGNMARNVGRAPLAMAGWGGDKLFDVATGRGALRGVVNRNLPAAMGYGAVSLSCSIRTSPSCLSCKSSCKSRAISLRCRSNVGGACSMMSTRF